MSMIGMANFDNKYMSIIASLRYPHSWSVLEITLLDILEPLEADVMEEQEGTLTYMLALAVKLTIHGFSLFRTVTGAMVTL